MQRRLWQAYTSLREHGSVGYAKIATIGGFCDLDLIIVKATAPDDVPLPEKYVHALLKIFSISPPSTRSFPLSFTRRFGKTRCWRVALKCLVLLHRLLRSLPDNNPFRANLLWARSNGLLCLYPCHFCDSSSSSSADFTLFIRSYARLLDDALNCFFYEKSLYSSESLFDKMKEMGRALENLPQLQNVMDRVMDCKPIGAAARSFVVRTAMKQIVRDSFACYASFRGDIVIVLDNLFQMQYRGCIAAFGIYKRAAIQTSRLSQFYESCKSMCLCGSYEYPFVEQIPQIHVRALEIFLNGMWQLTESSSSMTSSTQDSPSILTEEDGEIHLETVISTEWEKFEEDNTEEPLIQLEVNNVSWEVLLEASTFQPWIPRNLCFCPTGYGYENNGYGRYGDENEGWHLQVYNSNPFR